MELRHIRYFLAVAEEGNFTRAAARVGIGQPPLSLQIKDLEAEVGAQLFYRLPHGAELTEAGKVFLEAVKGIPDMAAGAKRAAQRASRGETGELRLGFTGTAAFSSIVPETIRAFRRDYPDAELKLEEANSVTLMIGLLEGRLDVAFLRPTDNDPDTLKVHKLIDETLVAALPASHLAAQGHDALDLAALRDEPLILTPRVVGTSLHDTTLEACRAAGFEPILGQNAPQIASLLTLVSAELGFAVVPASMRRLDVNGVAYRDIRAPAPHVALAVAHKSQRPATLAVNFASLARTLARK